MRRLAGPNEKPEYFHLSVPQALLDLYDRSSDTIFVASVDPLHKAGTVDAHIRKDNTFSWMLKLFSTCKDLYNKLNWGKNYELLIETCDELEKAMTKLVTFQTARFANSICFVVINMGLDYEAIVTCLQKIVESNKDVKTAQNQQSFNEATRLLNLVKTKRFCLHLSGIADIYGQFGVLVNFCKDVNILPHERYDNIIKVLDSVKFRVVNKYITYIIHNEYLIVNEVSAN